MWLYFHRPSVRHAELVKPTLLLVPWSDSPQFYKKRTEAKQAFALSLCISIILVAGLFSFIHSGIKKKEEKVKR